MQRKVLVTTKLSCIDTNDRNFLHRNKLARCNRTRWCIHIGRNRDKDPEIKSCMKTVNRGRG